MITTIGGLPGAMGMVAIGNTLYVALSTSGEVVAINLNTDRVLGVVTRGLITPSSMVLAGGLLWVGSGAALVSINPLSGTLATYTGGYFADLDVRGFRADPADSKEFMDFGGSAVATIDVASGSPVVSTPLTLYAGNDATIPSASDLSMEPNGQYFVIAAGQHYEFALGSVTPTSTRFTDPVSTRASAVATTGSEGGLVAGGLLTPGAGEPSIALYSLASGATLQTMSFPNSDGEEILPGTLSFDASGAHIYAVLGSDIGPPDTFEAIDLHPFHQ